MKFLVIRRADAETEAGVLPSEQLIREMTDFNEGLVKAGIMLEGAGLAPSAKGAKVKFNNGQPTIIDGPFTEAKELIAGYSILEVKDKAEVIEIVKRWPQIDGHGNVEVEIRQLITAEDFGPAFTPELQAKQARMDVQAEANRKGKA
jgi:hypothetical protein